MTLQPFETFCLRYLERLITLKKFFLVTQTYHRGRAVGGEQGKTNLLITDYDDKGLACTHYNAIREDRYAAVIDLRHTEHKRVLLAMLEDSSPYRLYWAVVSSTKELEGTVSHSFRDNMRRYILSHTDWRIARDTTIRPQLQLIFGELYLTLKYASQTLRVKFEEIEKA